MKTTGFPAVAAGCRAGRRGLCQREDPTDADDHAEQRAREGADSGRGIREARRRAAVAAQPYRAVGKDFSVSLRSGTKARAQLEIPPEALGGNGE